MKFNKYRIFKYNFKSSGLMFFVIKHLCETLCLLCVTLCKYYYYTEGHRGCTENHRDNNTKNMVLFCIFAWSKSLKSGCRKEDVYLVGLRCREPAEKPIRGLSILFWKIIFILSVPAVTVRILANAGTGALPHS